MQELNGKKQAIIIGAGPAGLTAAYELVTRTNIKPIIFEATNDIGGIAKTVNYRGNRMDIGGHRFFSKSQRIVNWWANIFPLASVNTTTNADKVMLLRNRVSRIFFLRKFFNYPISFSWATFKNLGLWRIIKIGFGYLSIRLFPIKPEQSLEDFFTNRFGKELYLTFFKDYTEKVWGIGCDRIKPEWGAQRIKGLSIAKTIIHAIKKIVPTKSTGNVETSLIDQFMYPQLGPGQLWEEVARIIIEKGGEIHKNSQVVAIENVRHQISSIEVLQNGTQHKIVGDYYFSTMPIKDLIANCKNQVPPEVAAVAAGLVYRDFITVGLLLQKLKIQDTSGAGLIPDNWIYIQEKDVKLGRIQVFNNWSPYLVKDQSTVWLGLEYFCNEGDALWRMQDFEFLEFATTELAKIDFIDKNAIIDGVVVRMPKTYPAYFGSYDNFAVVKNYLNQFDNLFLIGRNGMHRYNNMDHSMLTAMVAVDNIIAGITSKDNIWAVNTEEQYHETK